MNDGGWPPRDVTGTASVCGSCDIELPPNSKFCNQCGAATPTTTTAAEYKQVTVLFADVVHSMDIAAAVGPERWREIMVDLAGRCAAVVQRYGSTVTQWTGDGIMAVFGAPVALEDHAVRACLAALAAQREATRLGAEASERDGIDLRLRIGLNSGEVIAGAIGLGPFGYAAVGEQVGMAQRMESAAPPGGVMLSAATARLVEGAANLGEAELVRIKGAEEPVPVRRLLGMPDRLRPVRRAESTLVGRRWEMDTVVGLLDRATDGHGAVVGVVGPSGIGKSRLVREVVAIARRHRVAVFTTFCESHASDIPFQVVARLLRAATGVDGLDEQTARDRLRDHVPQADPEDLLLVQDLLGIADPDVVLPMIEPDARRRRLTALVQAASLARTAPAVYVIEDAHWIDQVSESMLADFLATFSLTPSLVLITYRPEYQGALSRLPGAHAIALTPLDDPETAALVSELLGSDSSVGVLHQTIVEATAGNPFFAEEIVRELAERGVLRGERGAYLSAAEVGELTVPATLQAAIAARIDRLDPKAKRTLGAAAVLGARFTPDLLETLGIDPLLADLVEAELIDPVEFTRHPEYVFHHPLIRTVAYESQLRSDRADLHRRAAAAIEKRYPAAAEENAALIAEHLRAAGELRGAYSWHIRAGRWCTNRDLAAARVSWERARAIADRLPDDPDQLSMRIAPRTMLCATDWQAREVQESRGRFAELRELCTAAGDKVSLAIGMTALATELLYAGRSREGSLLAAEQLALLESIGDPTPTMGLASIAFVNWLCVGEFGEILRRSQAIVDLAAGDPAKGADFGVGSPLAIALGWRGTARWWLGHTGWRQDLHDAVAMARRSNPETLASAVAWTYGFAIQYGVLRADDAALRAGEEAVQRAQRASSDRALGLAGYTLAVGLLNRDAADDRRRGLEWMLRCRDIWQRKRAFFLIPVTDIWAAREAAHHGDPEAAIAVLRQAVDELRQAGNLFYGAWGTGVLVQTLLERADAGDLTEAEDAIDGLANRWADRRSAMREITLLRLRTLLARARDDGTAYPDLVSRYRTMAESLSLQGHIDWAAALP